MPPAGLVRRDSGAREESVSDANDDGQDRVSYEILFEVTNVLNPPCDTESLWRVITGAIRQVISWERARA